MNLGLQVRGVGLGALGVGFGIQQVSESRGLCPRSDFSETRRLQLAYGSLTTC